MKVEHLESGSPDCPLVRLSDFGVAEARRLQAVCLALARGEETVVDLCGNLGVESVGGCRLTFRTGSREVGIVRATEAGAFECVLTREGWEDVALLIDPFTTGSRGYQWLTDWTAGVAAGDTRLLFSPSGDW